MQILLLGQLTSVRTVNSQCNGGEGYNFSIGLNPYTITSIQLQCIQAASPHLADVSHKQPKYCMYKSSPHINLHTVPKYEIIKYPKRVALATKYLRMDPGFCSINLNGPPPTPSCPPVWWRPWSRGSGTSCSRWRDLTPSRRTSERLQSILTTRYLRKRFNVP
jgi:hypothetical protein